MLVKTQCRTPQTTRLLDAGIPTQQAICSTLNMVQEGLHLITLIFRSSIINAQVILQLK